VGLSETIICIDLSNELEAFIEKSFCTAENEVLMSALAHKLIFIKDIYKDKQNGTDICYFQSIEKALPLLSESSTFDTNKITISDLVQVYECDKAENVSKVSQR
jgi:hypothetical protein